MHKYGISSINVLDKNCFQHLATDISMEAANNVERFTNCFAYNIVIVIGVGSRIKSPRQNPPGKNQTTKIPPEKSPGTKIPPTKSPRHKIPPTKSPPSGPAYP